jgi:hypothetical protein
MSATVRCPELSGNLKTRRAAGRFATQTNPPPAHYTTLLKRLLVAIVIVSIMMIVAIVVEVAVVAPIPTVVVLEPAVIPVPIALEVLSPLIPGTDPASAVVRRPRPVAIVPSVVSSCRIPIAIDPEVVRSGTHGPYADNPGRRRRANPNPNRELCMSCRRAQSQQHE